MKLGSWIVMLTVMIVFFTFVGLPTGLSPILDTVGINISSSTAQLIGVDSESSGFWGFLFGTTAGILTLISLAGAVTIGLYIKTGDTNILILPIIITIASLFIPTFWATIKYVMTFEQWWMTSIVGLIFSGLMIGFIMSCIDYFVGR